MTGEDPGVGCTPEDTDDRSKVDGERGLPELPAHPDFCLSILRPPLIHGVGVIANFLALLSLARLAGWGVPVPLGAARAPRSLLAVATLCEFLLLAARRGEPCNKVQRSHA